MASRELQPGYVVEERRYVERIGPPFDRVAYAMRLLRALRPAKVTVMVREGRRALSVLQGRAWHRDDGARWAEVIIPGDATKPAIAAALVALAGRENDPLLMEALLALPEPN